MEDRRLIYLLVFVLFVVTVSFLMVSFLGYHYYFEKKQQQKITAHFAKQPNETDKTFSDSLNYFFNLQVRHLHIINDSAYIDSSADTALAAKLLEFNRLRKEIIRMIQPANASKSPAVDSDRINQLEQSLEALQSRNDEIAAQNEKLSNLVKELMQKKGKASVQSDSKQLSGSAYNLPALVAHLRFVAISITDRKSITNVAAKTERLAGSFQINIKPYNKDNALYIVIVQPNGKTLINRAGQGGMFNTGSRERAFSTVIKFDNKRDNGNRLAFTIDSPNFRKGKYAMQIFHQGVMIGRLTRTLF